MAACLYGGHCRVAGPVKLAGAFAGPGPTLSHLCLRPKRGRHETPSSRWSLVWLTCPVRGGAYNTECRPKARFHFEFQLIWLKLCAVRLFVCRVPVLQTNKTDATL
jgi:hypothetical protein